jgi:hypothetical protein
MDARIGAPPSVRYETNSSSLDGASPTTSIVNDSSTDSTSTCARHADTVTPNFIKPRQTGTVCRAPIPAHTTREYFSIEHILPVSIEPPFRTA